jgi:hypothetical protein
MIDVHQHFGEICCLHYQGETVSHAKISKKQMTGVANHSK